MSKTAKESIRTETPLLSVTDQQTSHIYVTYKVRGIKVRVKDENSATTLTEGTFGKCLILTVKQGSRGLSLR